MGIQLSDAMTQYQASCHARRLAPRTIHNRMQALHHALPIWGNLMVHRIEPRHIDAYFAAHPDWKPATANLYLSSLRLFFEWARSHKHMERFSDPTETWRNARVERYERLMIPVTQFADLLDAADHPADRATIAIGLYTFARGSEISHLKWGHFDDLDGDRPMVQLYRLKTKERDLMPVCSELQVELQRYRAWYASREGIVQPHWFVIPRRRPNPLVVDPGTNRHRFRNTGHPGVYPEQQFTHPYRAVQRALAKLGYDKLKCGVHTLRASGARARFDELRDSGFDGALKHVSSLLGHANVAMTERYLQIGLERTQRNELLSGKPMFPSQLKKPHTVVDATERFGTEG